MPKLPPQSRSPASHAAFDQPVPAWIAPCLPTLVDAPPIGPEWQHELKWDGYRVSLYLDDGRATLYTRNGHDWTRRFPGIAAAAAVLPIHSAIIDGEAVVLDEAGRPSFAALQSALGTSGRGPGKREAAEACLYAFDLLFLDGLDLRGWSLANRRDALAATIGDADGRLLFSQAFEVTGATLFKAAADAALEGIVSKRMAEPYRSGRQTDWLKVKCVQDDTFVVIGYQPSAANKDALGAVHVAAQEAGGLRYVGAVGSGFSHRAASELRRKLDALGKPTPSIMGLKIKGARWAQPDLRVDVNFRARTREGLLRHASFKGVRED